MNIAEIDAQIEKLQNERASILEKEKEAAVAKVQAALDELNALGFNYELHTATAKPKRTRRVNIRQTVLDAIKAHPGSKPAQLAEKLGWTEPGDSNSISNALGALKKSGSVKSEAGSYTAV